MELQKFVFAIGSFIIALACMVIPALLILSFVLEWQGTIKTILVLFTLFELAVLTGYIYAEAEC